MFRNILTGLFILLSFTSVFAQSEAVYKSEKVNGVDVYTFVEVYAEFPGGYSALTQFLKDSLVYPVEAQNQKIEGDVHIRFVIQTDGTITDAKVSKGLHPLLDAEALRLINAFPKWRPGKIQGKTVASYYDFPVHFGSEPSKLNHNTTRSNRKEN